MKLDFFNHCCVIVVTHNIDKFDVNIDLTSAKVVLVAV